MRMMVEMTLNAVDPRSIAICVAATPYAPRGYAADHMFRLNSVLRRSRAQATRDKNNQNLGKSAPIVYLYIGWTHVAKPKMVMENKKPAP